MQKYNTVVELNAREIESVSGGFLGYVAFGVVVGLTTKYLLLPAASKTGIVSENTVETVEQYAQFARNTTMLIGQFRAPFLLAGKAFDLAFKALDLGYSGFMGCCKYAFSLVFAKKNN